jgi:hypothetical protein
MFLSEAPGKRIFTNAINGTLAMSRDGRTRTASALALGNGEGGASAQIVRAAPQTARVTLVKLLGVWLVCGCSANSLNPQRRNRIGFAHHAVRSLLVNSHRPCRV